MVSAICCRVSISTIQLFNILLTLIDDRRDNGKRVYYKSIRKENRLLMFLMKFKLGISFCALGCLFHIHSISQAYGGKATDAFIVNDSGFLSLLQPGDEVLADKGFPQIRSEMLKRNAILTIPPHAMTPQFTEEEVECTYNIASVRIHVERKIIVQTHEIILEDRSRANYRWIPRTHLLSEPQKSQKKQWIKLEAGKITAERFVKTAAFFLKIANKDRLHYTDTLPDDFNPITSDGYEARVATIYSEERTAADEEQILLLVNPNARQPRPRPPLRAQNQVAEGGANRARRIGRGARVRNGAIRVVGMPGQVAAPREGAQAEDMENREAGGSNRRRIVRGGGNRGSGHRRGNEAHDAIAPAIEMEVVEPIGPIGDEHPENDQDVGRENVGGEGLAVLRHGIIAGIHMEIVQPRAPVQAEDVANFQGVERENVGWERIPAVLDEIIAETQMELPEPRTQVTDRNQMNDDVVVREVVGEPITPRGPANPRNDVEVGEENRGRASVAAILHATGTQVEILESEALVGAGVLGNVQEVVEEAIALRIQREVAEPEAPVGAEVLENHHEEGRQNVNRESVATVPPQNATGTHMELVEPGVPQETGDLERGQVAGRENIGGETVTATPHEVVAVVEFNVGEPRSLVGAGDPVTDQVEGNGNANRMTVDTVQSEAAAGTQMELVEPGVPLGTGDLENGQALGRENIGREAVTATPHEVVAVVEFNVGEPRSPIGTGDSNSQQVEGNENAAAPTRSHEDNGQLGDDGGDASVERERRIVEMPLNRASQEGRHIETNERPFEAAAGLDERGDVDFIYLEELDP
ncbi:uncharacterized protein, partial [Fopius arisanus]|uniref:DDE Tnp4 domain-containing protein n=1 Tax=Fopius arisanus TaxID=64838 RepID=A0A9R1TQR1_9HYME